MGGTRAEELVMLLGGIYHVLIDVQVYGLTSARLDHDAGHHVMKV